MSRRSVGWLAGAVIGIGLFAYGTLDEGPARTNADRAYAMADRYACPVCNGQSVAESDVPIARTIRTEIRQRVDDGQTQNEITSFLRFKFGDEIDLNPSASGFTGLVWILPVVAGAGALAGLVLVFRKWQQAPAETMSQDDAELVDRARRST